MSEMTSLPGSPNNPNAPVEAKPVIVISSHVMAGAVGNRAAAFALERLGHPVLGSPHRHSPLASRTWPRHTTTDRSRALCQKP
ncbi:hypothetical protein [uncultured Cohaesibacter sp.]|uniref:hypothetical protein n=1 Tax=uncultured Cohaesibacter sp. TaxID=1002546 RepID=UPI00292CCD52|nr:hypothetical protein [uncultured Cohaesibacter sp.]